jgi:hypothetical protein
MEAALRAKAKTPKAAKAANAVEVQAASTG